MAAPEYALDYAELRRYCRTLVTDVGLSPPLEPAVLCARLAESRQRPIKLFPKEIPIAAAAGALMVAQGRDLITYQAATTEAQQAHIIYHELVHLVRAHLTGAGALTCGILLPEADTAPAQATRRNLYQDWQEWEAETGATILSEWSYWDLHVRASTPTSPRARRLYAALDDPIWD